MQPSGKKFQLVGVPETKLIFSASVAENCVSWIHGHQNITQLLEQYNANIRETEKSV